MTTTITIEIAEDRRTPIRRHVHVPSSDKAVNEWFDLQKDQSTSVRLLVHDEIAQHGMVDRTFRHKFGVKPTVTTIGTGSVKQPAQSAGAQPHAAPATPVVPAPWGVPMADPRDAEIARLRAEVARLENAIGPFGSFIQDLSRGDVLI